METNTEPTILTSVIGIAVVTVIVFMAYRYATGKWKARAEKQEAYQQWVDRHGKTMRRSIVIISLLYYAAMVMQLISL